MECKYKTKKYGKSAKRILISYGDIRFKESLIRLRRQAKSSGIFDKVITYTPEDLPPYVLASPLFAYTKGGGYWVWKPYIIRETLANCDEGDIVFYLDAGCTINARSVEWEKWTREIERYNAIFFQYREDVEYAGWESICKSSANNSVAIRHWMKPSVQQYFQEFLGNDSFLMYGKIWAGFCIFKKTKNPLPFLEQWFHVTMLRPDLIMDPFGKELYKLPETFNAHRHDQSIITPLIFHYKERDKLLVLPETMETFTDFSGVRASRYRQGKMPFWLWLKYRIYNYMYKE